MSEYDANRFENRVNQDTTSRRWLWNQWPESLSGKKVLDLGCGSGLDIAEILRRNGAGYGIDNSKRLVQETCSRFAGESKEWTVLEHDMSNLNSCPFSGAKFDIITARHSLQHVSNQQLPRLYSIVAKMIHSGGLFTFVVVHPMHFPQKYGEGDCKFTIYGDVSVTAPAHRFSDFISETFLNLFTIRSISEGVAEEADLYKSTRVWWMGVSGIKN